MRVSWCIIRQLMKIPRKFIFIGLVLVLVVSGLFYFNRPKQEKLETATVVRKDIKSTVSASGNLTGASSFDLKFRVNGKIVSLSVKAGDQVTQGQLLASLDNRDQIIALNQAQNNLRDKQAQADKTLDDIHLFQYGMGGFGNVATGNETMTQRALRSQAEVARDNAFDSFKSAQKGLEDTLIFAPSSGVVTQVPAALNQYVNSQDTVIRMSDLSGTYFEAEVDEADIGKISLGQRAAVTLDAYPDKVFSGEVKEIQPFTRSSVSGAMVITVRIKLQNLDKPFMQGLSGQVDIILQETKNALVVPLEAVKDDSVTIKKDNRLQNQKIKKGLQSEDELEVVGGLSEDEHVYLNTTK